MTDYTNLLERLAVSAGDQECLHADAKAAIEALQSRVAYLESRLEVAPEHDIDGIAARDATIKLQDGRIAELEADRNTWRDKYIAQAGQLDLLKEAATFLASERAEREKQEPVAWLDRSTEERPGDTVWLPDDLQAMSTRGLVPLYAAPPVITQHEPVTTVDDRHNADGKSCHITDDLPAGMKLYARPIHAEPVNARLLRLIKKARISIFDGLETPCELEHPASIDDRMLVTEIDSAIADAEAQQAGPVRLTDKNIDRALSERVPGGSEVRDWFLPHDTDRGHANILTVVRAIETFVLRANGFKVEDEQ